MQYIKRLTHLLHTYDTLKSDKYLTDVICLLNKESFTCFTKFHMQVHRLTIYFDIHLITQNKFLTTYGINWQSIKWRETVQMQCKNSWRSDTGHCNDPGAYCVGRRWSSARHYGRPRGMMWVADTNHKQKYYKQFPYLTRLKGWRRRLLISSKPRLEISSLPESQKINQHHGGATKKFGLTRGAPCWDRVSHQ